MGSERRRYFRIDDRIALSMCVLSTEEGAAKVTEFWNTAQSGSKRNQYNSQIEHHSIDLLKIKQSMPEVARYLTFLEQQVAYLSDELDTDEREIQLMDVDVNLSAQGIAFDSRQKVPADALVALEVKLMPSGYCLSSIARAVNVDEDATENAEEVRLSLDFENIREADREILVKHIHARQIEALRVAQEEYRHVDKVLRKS